MANLFMVCSEYHDVYSNEFIIEATDTEEAFKICDEEGYDYNLRGYLCLTAIDGPVHPSMYKEYVSGRGYVNTMPEPYHQPTFADLLR